MDFNEEFGITLDDSKSDCDFGADIVVGFCGRSVFIVKCNTLFPMHDYGN